MNAAAARLFRLVGLHPGPDLAPAAAASLAGLPLPHTRVLLDELVRAHLVAEHRPGRYTLHDLLRAYAAEQVSSQETDQARHAALHRLLDHYLHCAAAAQLLLEPHEVPLPLTPPQAAVAPEAPEDALTWFNSEHRVLLAAVHRAGVAGFDPHAWQLAATLSTFLHRQGHWQDLLAAQGVALHSAQRSGELSGQAFAHRGLSLAAIRLDHLADADTHVRSALLLSEQIGDHNSQARAHLTLAWLAERRARHAEALRHGQRALHLYQVTDHRAGQARALNSLGWNHAHLGEHQRAIRCCQQALPLHASVGDRGGEAVTWDSLGDIHLRHGDLQQAITCYGRGLALYRDIGDRYNEATVLTTLGDTHQAAGDGPAACDAWRRALHILDQLSHPDADHVRTRLAAHRQHGQRPGSSAPVDRQVPDSADVHFLPGPGAPHPRPTADRRQRGGAGTGGLGREDGRGAGLVLKPSPRLG